MSDDEINSKYNIHLSFIMVVRFKSLNFNDVDVRIIFVLYFIYHICKEKHVNLSYSACHEKR